MSESKLGGFFSSGPKTLSEDVAELKEELKTLNPSKQRHALHRVMTLLASGRNVSQLFPEVLNAMHSSQLDTKRLSHQFFLVYHTQFPDLSLLAINALKKDADDPNPLIRAQSLKTLAAIRLEEASEYLVDPVRKGLIDADPYVRKSAVVAVAKLCHFHPSLVTEHGLVETVLDLISDGNPAVVGNAAATVAEFLTCRLSVSFDLDRANSLLTALNDCNEWQIICILDLLFQVNAVFTDASSAVTRLLPFLSHGNAGVVLGTVRIVSVLVSRCTEVSFIRSVLAKLVPPLVSFLGDSSSGLGSSSRALQYEILRSINVLATRKAAVRMPLGALLIKYADPVSVKKEKIKLLAKLDFGASEADRVLIELKEIAATELDVSVVIATVDALTSLAMRPIAPFQADKIVSALLDILDVQTTGGVVQTSGPQTVSAQTQIKAAVLLNLVAMIRVFPGEFEAVIATIIEAWASLSAVQSQVSDAVAFVVAENATLVETETALSVFERIFTSEAELTSVVLTSALRLAIAVNNKQLLKRVIDRATAPLSSIDPDIRDRGLFYFKLIQADPVAARDILNAGSGKQVRKANSKSTSLDHLDLSHIGRLSSMYDQSVTFHRRPLHSNTPDDEDSEDGPVYVASSLVLPPPAAAPPSEEEGDEKMAAALRVAKTLVLRPDEAGAPGGVRGLRVEAGISDGATLMSLTVSNGGSEGRNLHGPFLIQFNRNAAGLSPKTKLIVGSVDVLKPGEVFSGYVELVASEAMKTATSGNLQVAVKSREDVWYFSMLSTRPTIH